MASRWKAQAVKKKKGSYWVLQRGTGKKRVSMSLGYLSDENAQRCARQMQIERDEGRETRLRQWHKDDRQSAIRYLIGDAGVEAALAAMGPAPFNYNKLTLKDYFEGNHEGQEAYIDWRAATAPGGWTAERNVWKRVLAELGHVRICDIDAHLVADYLDSLVALRGPRKGEPLSGNARRLHKAVITALLKRAYRLKHLDSLPNLAVFQIKGSTKTVKVKPDPLSIRELAQLLEAACSPMHRCMWAVGAGMGLRPSELVRLEWEHVDLELGVLHVPGSKTAKSKATVPLTGVALKELRRYHRERKPGSHLFTNQHGKPYASAGYRRQLATDVKAAGITRHVNPYLLRDSFATIAWNVGVEMDIARRILRHTNDTMLREVYCRPRPEDLKRFVEGFVL